MLLWLLVALALDKAQLVIAAPGYGSPYCGLGTTDGVLRRDTPAPMAYRVLMPWLLCAIEGICPALHNWRLEVYEALKVGMMALALWAVELSLGISAALLVSALLSLTWSFDYWDWSVELGALSLALGGNFQGAVIGGVLLGLSRETAPLVSATYLLATGNWMQAGVIALATGLTMLGVRMWAGYHKLYCDRFMWRRNLNELRHMLNCRPVFMANSVLSLLLTVIVIGLILLGRIGPTWPIPVAILGLGWLMGLAYETRIFASCLLWVSMGLLR